MKNLEPRFGSIEAEMALGGAMVLRPMGLSAFVEAAATSRSGVREIPEPLYHAGNAVSRGAPKIKASFRFH